MKFNQMTLPVTEMKPAVDFYLVLGFTQIVDAPHYARFTDSDETTTFSLSTRDETFHNGATIYFECDDLDDWIQRLVQRGVRFDHMPKDQPYLWREACLKDPSGNHIKLYQAGNNRLNPPWRVNITYQHKPLTGDHHDAH